MRPATGVTPKTAKVQTSSPAISSLQPTNNNLSGKKSIKVVRGIEAEEEGEEEEETKGLPQIRRILDQSESESESEQQQQKQQQQEQEQEQETTQVKLPPTSKRKAAPAKPFKFSPKVLRSTTTKTPLRSRPPSTTQSAQKSEKTGGRTREAPATEMKRSRAKK